jgi:hypothetical protein
MNRAGNFIDILPASALRTDRMQLDFGLGNGDVAIDYQHQDFLTLNNS